MLLDKALTLNPENRLTVAEAVSIIVLYFNKGKQPYTLFKLPKSPYSVELSVSSGLRTNSESSESSCSFKGFSSSESS